MSAMTSLRRIQNVAIAGASGRLGGVFSEELVKSGHKVTALTRIGGESTVPTSVKAAPVDYANENSLVTALKGQHFLVIALAASTPPDTHGRLVRAAAKAGVSYIMPNAYGPDVQNERLAKDDMYTAACTRMIEDIKGSGSSYIAMCCGFWYEWGFLLGTDAFGFDLRAKTAVFFDDGKTMVNLSTWRQCGRALAALLSLSDDGNPSVSQWKNKPLYISSFRTSQRDMLDSVHRVIGTTDADWKITYQPSAERHQQGLAALKQGDRSGFAKAMYARLFFPNGDSDYESSRGLANDALSLPQESLDDSTKAAIEMLARKD